MLELRSHRAMSPPMVDSASTIRALFDKPLLELVFQAASVHRQHHDPQSIQCASLLSAKTGGCPEDCAYCPQSARHQTELKPEPMMQSDDIVALAKTAQQAGADRYCIGTAWRHVRDGDAFDAIVSAVSQIKDMGMQTCTTLGMLNAAQARRLKEAGLDYYNHNLDSSPEFYETIISTRTYQERLDTLEHVRKAGIHICCGGIIGMGESLDDRVGFFKQLVDLPQAPDSIPINALVAVEGTPLADRSATPWHEWVQMIAVARILFPKSQVRLSAGRREFSDEAQAMAFLAGANSIFLGDQLLTTQNQKPNRDTALFKTLGLVPLSSQQTRQQSGVTNALNEAPDLVPA